MGERNWSRLVFLDPEYRDRFVDWEQKASDMVSWLRMDAGRHPDDPRLSALVGELSVKSEEFRRLWAEHDVKEKSHGVKRMRHPLVGDLTLSFETFRLVDDPDQSFVTYHAEPGSPRRRPCGCWRAGGRTRRPRRRSPNGVPDLGHLGPRDDAHGMAGTRRRLTEVGGEPRLL